MDYRQRVDHDPTPHSAVSELSLHFLLRALCINNLGKYNYSYIPTNWFSQQMVLFTCILLLTLSTSDKFLGGPPAFEPAPLPVKQRE